jgi:Cd2+/Zn2+-exporting ATPase
VRPTARAAIDALKRAGVERIVMLTGDNEPTARSIASQTGLTEFRAELLPQDKVAAVEDLVRRYGTVAMIGDGVNDAPAMARATFGVAMAAAGSDAAIESADVALMTDDLSRLPWLVNHSRRAVRIIRQNIELSIGVKAIFVLLTLGGFASLWAAIVADMGVSLLVIGNALRLLRTETGGNNGSGRAFAVRLRIDWVLVGLVLFAAMLILVATMELWVPHHQLP